MNLQANINSLLQMGAGLKKLGDIANATQEIKQVASPTVPQQEPSSEQIQSGNGQNFTRREDVMANLAQRGNDAYKQKKQYAKYMNKVKNRRKK